MAQKGEEAASKFINALIKSLQTLCHGYLEFQNGIEIIGHINLSVDKGGSLDYILKEKVCKNAENSTLFISNSFHAEAKPEEIAQRRQSQSEGTQCVGPNASMHQSERGKVASAISSISSSLSGPREKHRRSSEARETQHKSSKRRSSLDQTSEFLPAKISHTSSGSVHSRHGSSPSRSKSSHQGLSTSDSGTSETLLPQTASVGDSSGIGVNLAGSVLEPVENQNDSDLARRDDDSDGDLEVTFIKEEYGQGDSSADFENSSGLQFVGASAQGDGSRFLGSLPDGSAAFTSGSFDHGQQFSAGDGGSNTSQPGPSGMRGYNDSTSTEGGASQSPSHNMYLPSIDIHNPLDFKTAHWLYRRNLSLIPGQKPPPSVLDEGPKSPSILLCGLCDKSFTSASGLSRHKRCVHSSRRLPYICTLCGRGFHDKETHEGHMNMHNNVKAYQCGRCRKQFMYKTSLYHHIRNSATCGREASQTQ